MRKTLLKVGAVLFVMIALLVVYDREAHKVETPPFWFQGNQLDWEIRHRKKPVGVDQVSQAIINLDTITYVPWKRDELWAFNGSAERRHQWEGSRLLVRNVSGEANVFAGGGGLHPPLACDPAAVGKSLRQCLAPEDDGRILPTYNPGPNINELIRAAGGVVVEPPDSD